MDDLVDKGEIIDVLEVRAIREKKEKFTLMKRSVKTESTVFVGAFLRKTLVWKWILRVGRHDCVKVADFCFIF